MFGLNNYEFFSLVWALVSILCAVASAIFCYINRKTETGFKRLTGFNTFQTYTVCFFVSIIPIFFLGYFDQFSTDFWLWRGIKTLLLSVHNTVRLFILDGDFEIIKDIVEKVETVDVEGMQQSLPCLRDWISTFYSTYASALFIAAPVLTAGVVLSLFRNAFDFFNFRKKNVDTIYFISELNERSVILAENILKDKNPKKHRVAFFDVHEINEDRSTELIEKAKKLGTICFYRDIVDAYLVPRAKNVNRKFYFISENEDKNVKQALTLIKICRKSELYNTEKTAFYVFATTPDSELLLDAADNGNMIERRVNENRNLVISTLIEEPIFDKGHYTVEKLDDKQTLKHVTFLIVGSGSYGTELIKALSWCGQIPSYRIHLHVVDKEKNAKDRFVSIAPGFKDYIKEITPEDALPQYVYSSYDKYLDIPLEKQLPICDITFYSGVDVHGSRFIDIVHNIKNLNTVFVTLGEDSINVSVAMLLRRELRRHKIDYPEIPVASIYSVVYSAVKNDTLNQNDALYSNDEGVSEIHFIGNIRTRFSIPIIEQEKLEDEGLDKHMKWSKLKATPDSSEKSKPEGSGAESGNQEITKTPDKAKTLLNVKIFLRAKKLCEDEKLHLESKKETLLRKKACIKNNPERVKKLDAEISKLDAEINEKAKWLTIYSSSPELEKNDLKQKKAKLKKAKELEADDPKKQSELQEKIDAIDKQIKEKTALQIVIYDVVFEPEKKKLKAQREALSHKRARMKSYSKKASALDADIAKLDDQLFYMDLNNEEKVIVIKMVENAILFSKSEYHRRSSLATAVHDQVLINCKIRFTKEDDRETVEHIRWMAYLISEGYIYMREKNLVARTHSAIVTFDKLEDEIKKLDAVALNHGKSDNQNEGEKTE